MQQNRVGEVKSFSRFGRFSLLACLGLSVLFADQSFEDFKKSQMDSFKAYKDERDAAFSDYLKQHWEEFEGFKTKPMYSKPKPTNIAPAPVIKAEAVGERVKILPSKYASVETPAPKEIKKIEKPLEVTKPTIVTKPVFVEQKKPLEVVQPKIVAKPVEVVQPKIVAKPVLVEQQKPVEIAQPKEISKPVVVVKKTKKADINFNFFGSELGFSVPVDMRSANFYPQDQSGVSNFFSSVASSDYNTLLSEIKTTQKELSLNDWGLYLLITKISETIHKDSDNSKLLGWFLFNKLGYSVKIGLSNNHVVAMYYSKKMIYSTPNFNFADKRYYVISDYAKSGLGSILSYKQDYPNATKELDLSLDNLPTFPSNREKKELKFLDSGKMVAFPISYDKNIIDFMATYPQVDYETFFNAPLDKVTAKELALSLKKHVDGKKRSEAINFILHFVQNSFKYEQDDKQFGREKVMFAQETLFFDKSDCEDRAVLFSYLVKELLGIDVVGVKYDDHMATAVEVLLKGDKVIAGSKELVVADPTYINANVGMSMPQYKSIKPQSYIVVK